MGPALVIDASVVVDVLAPGADSTGSERLIRGLRWPNPITLMAPDLLFLEAANALRKMVTRKGISQSGADKAASDLDRLPIASVPCSSVLEGAWSLSGSTTAYDAAYLALARDLDLAYVTRDRRAARAAKQMGIRALHVGDADFRDLMDSLEPPSSRRGPSA